MIRDTPITIIFAEGASRLANGTDLAYLDFAQGKVFEVGLGLVVILALLSLPGLLALLRLAESAGSPGEQGPFPFPFPWIWTWTWTWIWIWTYPPSPYQTPN